MLTELLRIWELNGDPSLIGSWTFRAANWGWLFLSASARLMGLLMFSPWSGRGGVSIGLRIGLSFCLAAVIAPLLLDHHVPILPSDLWSGGVRLVTEFVVGALLGMGILFIFAALRLAGALIDQQAGLAVQGVFDPSSAESSTLSGRLLTVVGSLALVCAGPQQGYLSIVAALMDSFVELPATLSVSGDQAVLWIGHLGEQSLSLALRVAAPVLAAGVVVSWGLIGLSGRSGDAPVSSTLLGLPVRVVLSLLILAAALTGMTDAFLFQLEDVYRTVPMLLSRA